MAQLLRSGYTVVAPMAIRHVWDGWLASCAVVERNGERTIATFALGKLTGMFDPSQTRLKEFV